MRHEQTGRFLPDPSVNVVPSHIPIVIGGPAPVEPPTSHGPLTPPGTLDDYSRSELVKQAARISTEEGGTLQQRLEELAKARGVSVDPTFNPLAGI